MSPLVEPERLDEVRELQRARYGFDAVVANSASMRRVVEQLKLAAACFVPVAFVGEAGVESDLLARIVHYQSALGNAPLSVVDAAILAPDLLESRIAELTAVSKEPQDSTIREQTILLLSPERLERSAQRLFARLASNHIGRPRILAIDYVLPKQRIAAGELESDLGHALETLVIEVPALATRKLDLADMVQRMLAKCQAPGMASVHLDPAVLDAFAAYSWPGNVDELVAVLETARKKSTGSTIGLRDLPRRISHLDYTAAPELQRKPPPLDELLAAVERRMIRLALDRFKGNKSKAAEFLGISRARMIRAAAELEAQ